MKITFQGEGFHDILAQMKAMLAASSKNILPDVSAKPESRALPSESYEVAQGPGPEVVPAKTKAVPETPVDKPVEKLIPKQLVKSVRTAKQLENDAKLRERALAKKAAGTAFKKIAKEAGVVTPVIPTPPPPATAESLGLEPDEVVKLRLKTIADLQDAYANGHQKEVFELLSRFGNGAKSFRELPADAFVPISEAIANGALT